MSTQNIAATEYRNLPLSILTESKTNPRRIFEDSALKELADSIRSQGVLSPLLVRPLNERSFEIVAGARRYRAAQLAESESVPVRIVNLTDAEALEAQLIENLQRRDVHPLEEAQGFHALLNLDEPKYSIEQIFFSPCTHRPTLCMCCAMPPSFTKWTSKPSLRRSSRSSPRRKKPRPHRRPQPNCKPKPQRNPPLHRRCKIA